MRDFILPFDSDDDLLGQVRSSGRPGTRIYPFEDSAIVAGRGSDVEREVNMAKVHSDKISVFRRKGGGCSVFLDPGNLIVSMAFPARGFGGIQALFSQSSQWLIQGFRNLGLTGIYQDGISDLVMENRKIGGSCFYRAKGLAYYSASVLVSPDLDRMEAYLPHPPREPSYRRGRSHRQFVSGLNTFIPGMTAARLSRDFKIVLDASGFKRAA